MGVAPPFGGACCFIAALSGAQFAMHYHTCMVRMKHMSAFVGLSAPFTTVRLSSDAG